jgi:dTDP-4-amino-4,6-dideoxygalactose transaminase
LSALAVGDALTPHTRAVMTMSYGGHCGEVAEIAELCAEHDLLLLEDAAHGLGSRLDGRHLGTLGTAGAFSFFSNKNLAVGEGGAAVTDDATLAEQMRLLRSHGMTSVSWDRHSGHASGYDVVSLGYNYRIDEPRARLATIRLERLDRENARRAELDARYRVRFAELGLECPLAPTPRLQAAHHLFCVLLPPDIDRQRLRAALVERRIQTSMHYPPVHHFSIYADGAPTLPVTDDYARRAVTLPMFAHMTETQQDLVVDAITSALAEQVAGARA